MKVPAEFEELSGNHQYELIKEIEKCYRELGMSDVVDIGLKLDVSEEVVCFVLLNYVFTYWDVITMINEYMQRKNQT